MNKLTILAALAITNEVRLCLQRIPKNQMGGLCVLIGVIKDYNHRIYNEVPDADSANFIDGKALIHKVWREWHRYSGDPYFPIKAPWWYCMSNTPEQDYFFNGKNFSGRRLRDRKALMDFTHRTLQEMLEKYK